MNLTNTDQERGLYQKYRVERTDGSSEPGGRHEGCEYFVLDLDHDPFAYGAIVTYARRCSDKYPELADDLLKRARKMGEWMVQKHFNEMSPADRKAWSDMIHSGAKENPDV